MKPDMRRGLLLAALLLTFPKPAVAQATSEYDRGVAARLAGQSEVAIELLGKVVAAEPTNADAQLHYGLALLAAGRVEEAERAFQTTLSLAPNYEDARIALARVRQRRGDRAGALAELHNVGSMNSEANALRALLMRSDGLRASLRWHVDLDGSYSRVRKRQDWRDLSLRVTHSVNAMTRVGAVVEHSRRFGEDDTYSEIRIDHRPSVRANLWLAAGGTPNADFRPRWQVGAGGAFKLTDGPSATVATFEARHARYPAGDIETLTPGIEQYIPGGHWITARMINVIEDGDWRSGWLARGDFMANGRLRLFAGAANAPDVTEGVVVDTFNLFAGVVVDLNDRATLRLSVNREDRDGGANRLELGTGIGFRF